MMNTLNQATIACLLNAAISNWPPGPPLASYSLSSCWIRVRSCHLCPKPSFSLSPCLELRIPQKLQRLGSFWLLLPLWPLSASFTLLLPHWHLWASEATPAMLLPMATSCFFCLNVCPQMSSSHILLPFESFCKWYLLRDLYHNQLLASRTPYISPLVSIT